MSFLFLVANKSPQVTSTLNIPQISSKTSSASPFVQRAAPTHERIQENENTSVPCVAIPSLAILLSCCHQLSVPTLPWMLAVSFHSSGSSSCLERLCESVYNQKRIAMLHRNLAPQKRGIRFRWHQVWFIFPDLGYKAPPAITGHGTAHAAQHKNPLLLGGPALCDCRMKSIGPFRTETLPCLKIGSRCFSFQGSFNRSSYCWTSLNS